MIGMLMKVCGPASIGGVIARSAVRGRGAAILVLAGLLALPAAAVAQHTELVFDVSPFTPAGVGGELFGISSVGGHVIHARIDATYVSMDAGDWTLFANFALPTGVAGVDSQTEGWTGTGTFSKSLETDAFNGVLAPPAGQSTYAWFVEYVGGTPFTLPGGGSGIQPVNGTFTQLVLTLLVCDCPPGAWVDLGQALTGTAGEPVFAGTGNLCRGAPGTMELSNARPGGSAFLVLGLSSVWLPFRGGVLVPTPNLVLGGLPIDGAGSLVIPFAFPIGVPEGTQLWLQHWIPDPAGVFGYAASNALLATVPEDC